MRASDYSVATSDDGKQPHPWRWEIKCQGKSLGVKLTGNGYQSQMAAEYAGKRELKDFLAALAEEEMRTRK